jgi:oleate hydratase
MGNVIGKPMMKCAEKETMIELLSHLNFPVSSLLSKLTTISRLIPLTTSALLLRYPKNRLEVIPPHTTNIALVGQFTEIPRTRPFNVEYSI